ncbi:MAG: hypothetical protein HY320_04260 [Armatimonadetes bacterium]|nr:hypothetical protein [Armatimonadota bacterium]
MTSQFGLIGNGRVLARIHADGSLTDTFFPSVGFYRHIIQSQFGLFSQNIGRALWLSSPEFTSRQRYLEGTNVLETTFICDQIRCVLTDFVHPDFDVLVRSLELVNEGAEAVEVAVFHMEASSLEENRGNFGHNVAYFSSLQNHVVRYRGHPWDNALEAHAVLLIAGMPEQDQIQCGVSYQREGSAQDAFLDVADGNLSFNAYSSGDTMGATSALLWRRTIAPHRSTRVTILMAGAPYLFEAEEALARARAATPDHLLGQTVAYWREWLETGQRSLPESPEAPLAPRWRQIYLRSLLLLKLLQDARFGAIIAAPNLYPDYRYCWPRDGVFIAWALDRCGYHAEARQFYRWCRRTQAADGLWSQNYFTDGRRHWTGIQVDQVGTVIWGLWEHYRMTGDREFLVEMWPTVERAAWYVLSRIDPDLTLVYSEQDLWEETSGYLLYTNAASVAGLRAAATTAAEIGQEEEARAWWQAAGSIASALNERLVQDGLYVGEVNPHHPFPVREDYLLDISNLGATVPFGIIPAGTAEMRRTAAMLEKMAQYPVGGVGRYASDLFVGGNPWSLSALWLALYYAECGALEEAHRHLDWCLQHATQHDFLPEQVDKRTGEPASAHPLSWSHAWLVVALQRLGRRPEAEAVPAASAGRT